MVYTKQQQELLDSLAKEINEFDLYFEMSDSSQVIEKYGKIQADIVKRLAQLNDSDRVTIYMNLNLNGKQAWSRYFKTN